MIKRLTVSQIVSVLSEGIKEFDEGAVVSYYNEMPNAAHYFAISITKGGPLDRLWVEGYVEATINQHSTISDYDIDVTEHERKS